MSKFTTKADFLAEIDKERTNLEVLLDSIPESRKTEEVIDGMSVKDFLAHRTEWGRMMLRWYSVAKEGGIPAVPTERWKWNQLKELNAEIKDEYSAVPLANIESQFAEVHDELRSVIDGMTEDELFTKKYYSFTGTSDLVTYANSATASHYRSARRHINKWWKAQMA